MPQQIIVATKKDVRVIETGPVGPKGKDGIDGVDGINGINGIDGVDGINGINGINGIDGADGVPLATNVGTVNLIAGTATINTTVVKAESVIFLSVQSVSGVSIPQALAVAGRVADTSFNIQSASTADTSLVAWFIVDPA